MTKPADIPSTPGVYRFVDGDGRVLYVGKAKNLAQRLGSYFTGDHHPRTRKLLTVAADVDWTICASETEALVLERDWIRTLQPAYNVRLRHGGGYPGLAVTRSDVPRVHVWREQRPVDADTFGPYPGTSGRELIDAVAVAFGVRSCDDATYRRHELHGRPCLLGETQRCLAPCLGDDETKRHQHAARQLRTFLERPDPKFFAHLHDEMAHFASEENFEAAARRRDRIHAFEVISQRQRIANDTSWHRRAVVVRRNGRRVISCEVSVTGGVVTGVDITGGEDDPLLDDRDLLEQVIGQRTEVHDEPTDAGTQREPRSGHVERIRSAPLLTEHRVEGGRPPRGERERNLMAFAAAQAEEALRRPVRTETGRTDLDDARRHLHALLGGGPLRRIECIDISHLGGREAFGSLVVFVDDEMRAEQYRTLGLGDSNGDDYQAIGDTVTRRLSGNRMGLFELPDLLVIDGGPGQLAAAQAAMGRLADTGNELEGVRVVSLAKRFEELWLPEQETPVRLAHDDPALRLLTLLRDSAHDNGLRAHRRSRDRQALRTGLDDVPGLGPARRKALLAHFSTIDGVSRAAVDEIARVPGIGPVLAGRIRAAFDGVGTPGDMTIAAGEAQ